MSIKIETEQVLIRGEKRIKVIKIEALTEEALPFAYVNGSEFVYRYNSGLFYKWDGKTYNLLFKDDLYTEDEIKNQLETIKRCGNILQEINARLKKENEGWEGKGKTYII